MKIAPHHAETIRNLVKVLESDQRIQALILGGSIAHGFARPDSDVDVSIVVERAEYQRRTRENRLQYHNQSLCTYPEGYIDGKYVDIDFLQRVAESGSDPARFAYQNASILFSRVPGLADILAAITRYPVAQKRERIERFAAQLLAWQWFYTESVSKRSRYLEVVALQKVVLFTCRIVLVSNELFYPFHKWLLRVTETAPDRPASLLSDLDDLLAEHSTARVDAHIRALFTFYGIDYGQVESTWPTFFMKDSEMAWLSGHPAIDDL